MDMIKFSESGRDAFLYRSGVNNSPLVVMNVYSGDGGTVYKKLSEMNCPDMNFLCVAVPDWNAALSPHKAEPVYPGDDFSGGAAEYLHILISEIIPAAREYIGGTVSYSCIAGYSLAGLFALWALHECDVFERAASISGSLWFPGFREYVSENPPKKFPDKIYISLGDKEAKTKNPVLKTVRENTEFIAEHYSSLGIDVTFEMNPGNHFRDEDIRTAKGICAVLKK